MKTKNEAVIIRIRKTARQRFKINAVKEGMSMIDFLEELSKQSLNKISIQK